MTCIQTVHLKKQYMIYSKNGLSDYLHYCSNKDVTNIKIISFCQVALKRCIVKSAEQIKLT